MKERGIKNNTWYVLGLCGQLGLIIALPIVVLAYTGRLLDIKFQASPLFILAGIFLAIIISGLIIWKLIKKLEEK